jgi:hypothetical protein
MTPEQIQQALDYLRKLGEAAVTKGYDILSRQVLFNAIHDVIWVLVGIALTILGACLIKGRSADDGWWWMAMLGLIFGAVLIFVFIFPAINALINPDWMAIQMILNAASGK